MPKTNMKCEEIYVAILSSFCVNVYKYLSVNKYVPNTCSCCHDRFDIATADGAAVFLMPTARWQCCSVVWSMTVSVAGGGGGGWSLHCV